MEVPSITNAAAATFCGLLFGWSRRHYVTALEERPHVEENPVILMSQDPYFEPEQSTLWQRYRHLPYALVCIVCVFLVWRFLGWSVEVSLGVAYFVTIGLAAYDHRRMKRLTARRKAKAERTAESDDSPSQVN